MGNRFMAGLIGGFKKSQDRYRKIQVSRDNQRIKDEQLDLRKQELDFKKKKFEAAGKMDPVIQGLLDVEYSKIKAGKDISAAGKAKSDEAGRAELKKQSGISRIFDALKSQGIDPSYSADGFNLRPTKADTPEKIKNKDVYGMARDMAARKNGKSVDDVTDKQIQAEMANSRRILGGGKVSMPKLELPGKIRKTSEALDYLMQEKNMEKGEALQWLRENNQKTIKVK